MIHGLRARPRGWTSSSGPHHRAGGRARVAPQPVNQTAFLSMEQCRHKCATDRTCTAFEFGPWDKYVRATASPSRLLPAAHWPQQSSLSTGHKAARTWLAALVASSFSPAAKARRRKTARAPAVRITTQRRCRREPKTKDSAELDRSAEILAISLSVCRATEAQAPEGSKTIGTLGFARFSLVFARFS